jgi:hypothetical protein
MDSPQQPRQAPPVGRALRILLGLALMVFTWRLFISKSRANFDESVAADAWITWTLQPNSYPDIATNHYLRSVRRGHRGGGIAYSTVRGELPRNIDPQSRAR